VTRYEYDPLGPLRKVTLPDGMTVSYLLDALGRPCQKLVNGKPVQTFLFDQHFRVIAEVDGQNVRSRFVYGTRWHAPEYIETDGRTLFLISDELGTPRLVVDVANAAIVQRLDFDEFGMLLGDTSAAPRQPFGFAGGVHDADTGLTRFGARHYDARSGRWTQPDPLGYAAGTNLYEYVGGDPVNTIDPLGLSSSGETPSEGSTIEEIPTQPDYLPPETGRPVDNLNPPPKPFDIIDYIFNPKDPGPNPAGVPGRPPERGRYDFDVRNPFGGRNIRCFVSGQNRYPYGQEDGGGLGRDSYTGHPRGNNDYNTPLSTTGIGLGVSF
jgi:RHS repeat-associated protein